MERKCEQCGKIFQVRRAEVNRGNGRFCNHSCATTATNLLRLKRGRKKLTYIEQKNRYGKRFWISSIVGGVQGRCRKRNEPCELTPALFRSLWKEQTGKCYYSGAIMTLGGSTKTYQDMEQASIDRIVPSKGYVKGNMALCCRWTNVAKGQDDVSKLAKRVDGMAKYQELTRIIT